MGPLPYSQYSQYNVLNFNAVYLTLTLHLTLYHTIPTFNDPENEAF